MIQFLPRGYTLTANHRITKLLSEGSDWQIFRTNLESYVLAVTESLFLRWVSEYDIPEQVFQHDPTQCYRIFCSSGNYLISSIDRGPFPECAEQIVSCSYAIRSTLASHPAFHLQSALYLEEYSLLLPDFGIYQSDDNNIALGKWLTGGIEISVSSIERLSQIMTWIPRDTLISAIKTAGFPVTVGNRAEALGENSDNRHGTNALNSTHNCNTPGKGNFSLVGRPELEHFFNEHIIDIINNQEKYNRMGIPFPGATILYGPPGCGKTYAVDKLSDYLGWRRFEIDSNSIASSYIHDTSKKIAEVFRSAIESAPSILVIDEMEAFLSNRGTAGSSSMHHNEEVAEFLRRIPEAVSSGVLIFGMTNMIDLIDPAVCRRGRFDHLVEVKMASAEEIEALLKDKCEELPIDETVSLPQIAMKLSGHPLSDVAFVLREAGRLAVRENLEYISQDCFTVAISMIPKKKERNKIGFV